MLGKEDKSRLAGGTRKAYLRSASWTARSPSKPNPNPNPNPRQPNNKARPCLPPLQPLSITRRSVEEWPRAGSDDLGVWPHPQTPRESVKPSQSSSSEQPVREFQFKKDKLAFFDKECSKIVEHIYLGSDAVAKNLEVLRQNGITHVLNCVGFVCPEYFKNDFVYKTLWLQDSPTEDITSILYDVFDYFEDVREQNGRVFVHCCQGVSRSTSLVIAYLMWREGQSFEDAFQYVKATRGVTNPNMGFACQLLQCQKRVHAVPASPNSVLRMYRMAPHSPYDPLHLVPKMLNHPSAQVLDSRGAFVVHVPSSIYVWMGTNCDSMMSNMAKKAASQVIRYERAKGPIVSIKEGEEPSEFWDTLANGQLLPDCCEKNGERKVGEYNLDFELFHQALSGGVVPPFGASNTGSENCLPARGNGWDRVRRKFANGIMKELVTLSTSHVDTSTIDISDRTGPIAPVDASSPPLSPTAYLCGSPDSFVCFPNNSPDRLSEEEVERSVMDSFDCFSGNSPKFSSKSPTLSPSTSDYSSFSFSPSSSNWSDLSYISSRQPSPSGLDSMDPVFVKNSTLTDNLCLNYEETSSFPAETFNSSRGSSPSIAERRGSNPPPLMLLPSIEEPRKVQRNIVRSASFSLPDVEFDLMEVVDYPSTDLQYSSEELMMDIDRTGRFEESSPALYKWPSMNKVERHQIANLDSKSAYIMLFPNASFNTNSNGIVAFVWVGREVLYEERQSRLICSNDKHNNGLHWEMVGQSFIDHMGLPRHAPIQVIREGEEPEQFQKHLSLLLSEKVEENWHS